ncbi:type II secretion system protein [Pseudoduganella sp. OTU4001]|uniref:type II secretion system protein n=1 Tax=Pseudoduganella sp. OTU4001 TaxID=3043854 RepID=UPI00313B2B2C
MTILITQLIRRSSNVALPQQKRQRGASYFEFAVVVIIFAILSGILLRKMQFYQVESERLTVQQVATSLRAALASRAVSLYLRGNEAEVKALARQNPMEWLERRPSNYAGEFESPKPGVVPDGYWYFDKSTATLSYLLKERELFGGNDAKRLNFKVKFAQNPSNITNNHEGPGIGGVTLEQTED